MIRVPVRGVCLAAAFITFHCSGFDGHVENLPADVEAALAVRAKETPEELEKANADETEITVGKITVLNQTVLPASDFFAPLLNNVHHVTQKDVIASELDFKEGDKIPRYKLYDAERYVRLLDPIKQARIVTTKNPETGKTDVTVVTQDKYTPQFSTGASGSGGYSSFGVNVVEPSVMGRLYSWGASYGRENFRDYLSLGVGKARINGSRWEIGAGTTIGFANSQYNYQSQGITLSHPFTRNGQRHSLQLSASFANGVNYDYLGGGINQGLNTATQKYFDRIYRTKIENISAQYLYGVGKNDRIEFGPGVWHYIRRDYYIYPTDQYSLSETPELPVSAASKAFYQAQQYSTHALTFSVNTRNGNFAPMRNFQRYLFTEDQFEGLRTSTKIIYANPSFGLNDHYTAPSFGAAYQKNLFDQKFRIETSVARSAIFWYNGVSYPTDDLWAFDFRGFYFTRFGTLALRGYLAKGNHLTKDKREDIANQLRRGFSYGSVYPSAGHLTSLEYRSPGWKLPYLLVAGVLFFDYAGVGETLSTLTYYSIAGLGLRTMLHEFDNNVFRIDFGFNLNSPEFNLLNALQFGVSHTF